MIITKVDNEKYSITFEDVEEAVRIINYFNEEYLPYAPQNAYDVEKFKTLDYPLTIHEDECKNEDDFLFWEDDFDEVIRQCGIRAEVLNKGESLYI